MKVRGRSGHARDAFADERHHGQRARQRCRADHRRPFLRRQPRLRGRPRHARSRVGGPLAVVRNGDPITIDAERRVHRRWGSGAELAKRNAGVETVVRAPTPAACSPNTRGLRGRVGERRSGHRRAADGGAGARRALTVSTRGDPADPCDWMISRACIGSSHGRDAPPSGIACVTKNTPYDSAVFVRLAPTIPPPVGATGGYRCWATRAMRAHAKGSGWRECLGTINER